MSATAFVAIGANLADPRSQVLRAIDEIARLPHCALTARSSLWRSAPIGYADQPEFVNAVVQLESALSAEALLDALQGIESRHGRERSFADAPRTLDLDLLLLGEGRCITPRVTLPHPRMHQRAFVLSPLLEIAPDTLIPGHGPARACLEALTDQFCTRMA